MWRAIYVALFILIAAQSALIPPGFTNTVVALGGMQPVFEVGRPPRLEWQTEGTGFFYGYLVKDDPDPLKRQYDVYLITAKHVITEHQMAQRGEMNVRVNPTDSSSRVQEFTLPNEQKLEADAWFYHPDQSIDLAAIRVNLPLLRERGFQSDFFANDQHAANRDKLKNLEVAAGDGAFVLGFPMNLAGVQRNYVIVRQGCIARISEMLDRASTTFMLDAFVFPGNSGGPVVLKPELTSITGTKNQTTAYLIGLVMSYRPYNDVAVSAQTKQARVIFQENSGLAEVIPTDYIDQAIKAFRAVRLLRVFLGTQAH